jgi:hypothetical protein
MAGPDSHRLAEYSEGARGLQSLSSTGRDTFPNPREPLHSTSEQGADHLFCASDLLTRQSRVATVIESLLRGPMRISAPGDCNHALRQSSGALAVQIGLTTSGSGDGIGLPCAPDELSDCHAARAPELCALLRGSPLVHAA